VRPPRIFASADFWRGLVIVALAVVVVWLYQSNRQLIESRDETIGSLCETKRILGEGFRQLRALDREFVRDPALALSTRATVRARLAIYTVMLDEFSDAKPCEGVE